MPEVYDEQALFGVWESESSDPCTGFLQEGDGGGPQALPTFTDEDWPTSTDESGSQLHPFVAWLRTELAPRSSEVGKRLDRMSEEMTQVSIQLDKLSHQIDRKFGNISSQASCVADSGPAMGGGRRPPSKFGDDTAEMCAAEATGFAESELAECNRRLQPQLTRVAPCGAAGDDAVVDPELEAPHELADDSFALGERQINDAEAEKRRVAPPNSLSRGLSGISGTNRRNIGTFSVTIWRFLEDPDSSTAAQVYARLHSVFICAGVIFLLSQTIVPPPIPALPGAILDVFFDVLLLIEVTVRYLVCPMSHLKFCQDPFNLIDLTSTGVPLALRVAQALAVQDASLQDPDNLALRLLWCVVPVLRLLKILRRFTNYRLLSHSFVLVVEAMPVLLFTFVVLVLVFSSIIYLVEDEDNIGTIPEGVWFTVVTMTTVGYGRTTPQSVLGHVVMMIAMIVSGFYTAMPLSIIGNAFNTVWGDRDRIVLMKKTKSKIEEWGYTAVDIPNLFRQFDVDGNGELDVDEFRELMKEMNIGLADDRVVALFESFDDDRSGTVDDKEFVHRLFPFEYHSIYGHEIDEEEEGDEANDEDPAGAESAPDLPDVPEDVEPFSPAGSLSLSGAMVTPERRHKRGKSPVRELSSVAFMAGGLELVASTVGSLSKHVTPDIAPIPERPKVKPNMRGSQSGSSSNLCLEHGTPDITPIPERRLREGTGSSDLMDFAKPKVKPNLRSSQSGSSSILFLE